jgi:hypothetical protein
MSDPSTATAEFLAALAYAYEHPAERADFRRQLGVTGSLIPEWNLKQATIAQFLDTTIARAADARPRLQTLLTDLGWRPSRMPERVQHALGLDQRREDVLAAIVAAFPVAPLEGRVLREAYLEDERGFRPVPPEEVTRARAEAVTWSWRDVPDEELDFAFGKNSVYTWLDPESLAFYMPACLSYALRESGQCEFYTFLHFAKMTHARALQWYSPDQGKAIAGFMAFVAADVPTMGILVHNRSNVETWIAAAC